MVGSCTRRTRRRRHGTASSIVSFNLAEGIHRFEARSAVHRRRVMALFGAPAGARIWRRPPMAWRCLSATSACTRACCRQGPEIAVGWGSTRGVVGSIGDDLRMHYTALGRRSASPRDWSRSRPGRIYLSEHTARWWKGSSRCATRHRRSRASPPGASLRAAGKRSLRTRLDASVCAGSHGWSGETASSPGSTASLPGRSGGRAGGRCGR
jgi:hypothetical protein